MNNIEKLAKTHCIGTYQNSEDGERFYFRLQDLEAFAKALQQSSEPVALKAIPFATVRSQDSLPNAMGEKRREYYMQEIYPTYWPAHGTVLYRLDGMEVNSFAVDRSAIELYTLPPATVPLEKYNKLLDALRDQVGANDRAGWLGEIDDMLFSILDDEQYAKVSREINGAKSEGLQAIAEAEGKEG